VSKDYVTQARRALKPQLDPVCRRSRMIAATVACSTSSASAGFAVTGSANFPTQALPVPGFDRWDGLFCHGAAGGVVVVGASHAAAMLCSPPFAPAPFRNRTSP